MKDKVIIFMTLVTMILVLGCTGTQYSANETKLDINSGLGVVGNIKIDELNPGLSGYVSLTVRNNLGGHEAKDVKVTLDNVRPFKILECGKIMDPTDIRPTGCAGVLEKDEGLPVKERRTDKLLPGQEIDVYWMLKAPTQEEISNIGLRHPIYYNVEYSYVTDFHENIFMMSQQEQIRRKQAGEPLTLSGESGMTAGELRFSGSTQQPIVYFFSQKPGSGNEAPFEFALSYLIENKGQGLPLSDLAIILEYPEGINVSSQTSTYGWKKLDELKGIQCNSGIESKEAMLCEEVIDDILKNSFPGNKSISFQYNISKENGERIIGYADNDNLYSIDIQFLGVSCEGIKEVTIETKKLEQTVIQKYKYDEISQIVKKDYSLFPYKTVMKQIPCYDWLNNTLGEKEFGKLDKDKTIVKIIPNNIFVKSFNIYAPLEITGEEMTNLRDSNIPLTMYTFRVHALYRYFIEGNSYINIYPIKIQG